MKSNGKNKAKKGCFGEFVSPEVTEYFCLNLGRSMVIRMTIKAIRTTIKAGPVRSTSAGFAQISIGRS